MSNNPQPGQQTRKLDKKAKIPKFPVRCPEPVGGGRCEVHDSDVKPGSSSEYVFAKRGDGLKWAKV